MDIDYKSSTKKFLAGTMLLSLLSGCVNDSGTSALTNSDVQAKLDSHEQRHVASKCNSADRLSGSNTASSALNAKYTEFTKIEATLSSERKNAVIADLQAQGSQLEALDRELTTQCVAWAKCEYKASTTKESCAREQHKYRDANKQIATFNKKIARIKIN